MIYLSTQEILLPGVRICRSAGHTEQILLLIDEKDAREVTWRQTPAKYLHGAAFHHGPGGVGEPFLLYPKSGQSALDHHTVRAFDQQDPV
jgi:hypothetical protein